MTTSHSPNISVQNGVTVVEMTEEHKTLNESHVEAIGNCIMDLVEKADPPLMVIDLTQVEFFGSSFIEVLFRAWNKLSKREGSAFSICRLSIYCKEVVEVTHLDRLWKVYGTAQEAVAALSVESK